MTIRIKRGFANAMCVLASAVLLPGCSSSVGGLQPISNTAAAEYRVGPGDRLRITVQDLKDASADYTIDDTGMVSLPLIKSIPINGKTYREVELAIEDELRKQQILVSPKVSVQPLELRPFYIMGEVARPGEYPYRQGMTVFSAISIAGGYTYRAATGSVEVTRNLDGKKVVGSATAETPIQPGDHIRVVEKWF